MRVRRRHKVSGFLQTIKLMSENFFDRDGSRGYGDGHSREGRSPRDDNKSGRFGGESGGHAPRQRFSRPARPTYGGTPYGSKDNTERGGSSRPRYGSQDGYAPRENRFGKSRFGEGGGREGGFGGESRHTEGGYRQGGGYRQEGGAYRPRFSSQDGYTPRENRFGKSRFGEGGGLEGGFGGERRRAEGGYRQGGGYQRQEGGFRPRFNGGGNDEGAARGSFRPRFRQDGGSDFRSARPQRSGNYDPNAKYSHKKRMEYKEEHIDPNQPIRLNRYLANAGICSRRDADKYIEAGVVTVNGAVVTELGTKVLRTDEVRFHDEPVKIEKKVYVLLNKPKGYVTTSEDPENRKTVMDLVQGACPERIYPVGRLDRNTTGVLLLTNDGDMASKLTHPKFLKKKIYHVTTDKSVAYGDLQRIADGIELEDGVIKADEVAYANADDKKEVGIEIHSGRNRIVRRIFESLGYHVVKLDRVYFAGLTKKNVRRGDWRYLTEKEVNMLRMGAFE